MLTQIRLTNFKCFKSATTFPLSQFNLLTGVNGSGKSTLLQSLLLMLQSIEYDAYTTRLILNGSYVNLGNFDDVRHREISASESIFFEFAIQNVKGFAGTISYQLESANDDMSLHIPEISIKQRSLADNPRLPQEEKIYRLRHLHQEELYQLDDELINPRLFRLVKLAPHYFKVAKERTVSIPLIQDESPDLIYTQEYKNDTHFDYFSFNDKPGQDNLNLEKIHFISADRIGPQEFYQKAALPQFPHVGARGEFAVNLLDKMAQELVKEELCLGEDSRTLITQTEAWLGKILNKPRQVAVRRLKGNILELAIGGYKPTNVEFGCSSILPIIISGLIAKPGEKLIVENPEIHLHPKAQSALIQFLIMVTKMGVQVFVESHSDHVLNGVRVAVKEGQLDKHEVAIFFHDHRNSTKEIKVTPIKVDNQGELNEYPTNFFDEYSNQLFKLV